MHDPFLSGHYSGALRNVAITRASTTNMELPIFNDNLRSSGSWTAQLANEQEKWKAALARAEHEASLAAQLRSIQVEQMVRRAVQELEGERMRAAAQLVSHWAAEPEAKLTSARLLALHRALIGAASEADVVRRSEPLPLAVGHDPTPALLVPRMLDHAFDWFATPSFAELHPVEQATVVYLRLLDLHPFANAVEPTALLAASFYTERAALPPLIIFADETTQARYAHALAAAFRMLTQPLVELLAEMLVRALQLAQGEER